MLLKQVSKFEDTSMLHRVGGGSTPIYQELAAYKSAVIDLGGL